ncbi:MAG: hypothetical protein ABFD08_02745 [Syntrophomonas sp.]
MSNISVYPDSTEIPTKKIVRLITHLLEDKAAKLPLPDNSFEVANGKKPRPIKLAK